jgi:hypothetical protein
MAAGVVDTGGAHLLYLIYVAGGADNSGFGITKMESYNPATNTWSTEPPMKTARYHLAGDDVNGIFYAIGGQIFDDIGWVEAYDPGSKTWTTKTNMPTGRYGLGGVAVNGIFYTIGGADNCTFCSPAPNSLAQAYTPGATSVTELSISIPSIYTLEQNYPNPFNPSTTVKFELPKTSMVRLNVYDMLGREVSVLVNERREAGVHEVKFDGSNLASGAYLYRLQAGDFLQTKRLLLLK